MRIGLLRHFPVKHGFPSGWRTSAELQTWRERYEMSETTVGEFDLGGIAWEACIASDLPRAKITATAVFRGEIEHTPELREAQFASFGTGGIRLPMWCWGWMLRLAWKTGHSSQRTCRDEFQQRIVSMADRLSGLERDTLVVSHAGVMIHLSGELRRRGFAGPKLSRFAKHAVAYIYQRQNDAPALQTEKAVSFTERLRDPGA